MCCFESWEENQLCKREILTKTKLIFFPICHHLKQSLVFFPATNGVIPFKWTVVELRFCVTLLDHLVFRVFLVVLLTAFEVLFAQTNHFENDQKTKQDLCHNVVLFCGDVDMILWKGLTPCVLKDTLLMHEVSNGRYWGGPSTKVLYIASRTSHLGDKGQIFTSKVLQMTIVLDMTTRWISSARGIGFPNGLKWAFFSKRRWTLVIWKRESAGFFSNAFLFEDANWTSKFLFRRVLPLDLQNNGVQSSKVKVWQTDRRLCMKQAQWVPGWRAPPCEQRRMN